MLSTAILVFREVLEAALIIGLVAAATTGMATRGRWIATGLVAGIGGAVVLAFSADFINQLAAGLGQELLNALILMAAVIMLGWHNIWMKKHGQELAGQVKRLGERLKSGETELHAVAIIVGLAVLREGAELVLFLYGVMASGTTSMQLAGGFAAGLLAGIAVGGILYFGLLRIPTRYLFKVTSLLILLLAAGLASQAAAYLVQADILPALGMSVWNTSWLLSQHSVVGSILHTLIGYVDRPMGIQVIVYLVTLLTIGTLMKWVNEKTIPRALATATALGLAVFIGFLSMTNNAHASHKVYSPSVDQGEVELEYRGHTTFDSQDSKDDQEKHILEAGYGVTDRWFTALFGEFETEQPSGDLEYAATGWENILQLTEQGEKWVDVGLYLEYELANETTSNDKTEAKLLLEKLIGNSVHTANIIFEREVGSGASNATIFGYAWHSKWLVNKHVEPGIEVYGEFGELGSPEHADQQDHRAGPVISGVFDAGIGAKLAYELGYLFGLTDASPGGTLKAVLEYEFPF